MDNGEEIPGLNEEWSFMGAKLFEWVSGFVAMIIFNEMAGAKAAMAMPLLLMIMVGTTLVLAGVRSRFPDEERGVRNLMCLALGFAPPGIPTPSALQPVWSGAPARALKPESKYEQLGLSEIFPEETGENDDDEMF